MSPIQISDQYTSIDEMAEKTGFDMNFCQLEPGEPILKTRTTVLSSIVSSEFYFNKAFHQQGIAPDRYFSFGIPQRNSSFRWMGKDIDSAYLFDFNARSGFDIKSGGPFSAKTIHINVDRFYATAEAEGIDLSELGEVEFAVPKLIDPAKLSQLQDALQITENLVSTIDHQPQGKADITMVEDSVYRKLTDCLDFSLRNGFLSHSNRHAIKRRAIEFIQSNHREIITISEICRACATTSRTLERVFREELGVTPKQYLTLVKLSGARHDLCEKNQDKSIRDIAISRGFWHMGQFAQDYKNQYGELPSQTRQWQHFTPNHHGISLN